MIIQLTQQFSNKEQLNREIKQLSMYYPEITQIEYDNKYYYSTLVRVWRDNKWFKILTYQSISKQAQHIYELHAIKKLLVEVVKLQYFWDVGNTFECVDSSQEPEEDRLFRVYKLLGS